MNVILYRVVKVSPFKGKGWAFPSPSGLLRFKTKHEAEEAAAAHQKADADARRAHIVERMLAE